MNNRESFGCLYVIFLLILLVLSFLAQNIEASCLRCTDDNPYAAQDPKHKRPSQQLESILQVSPHPDTTATPDPFAPWPTVTPPVHAPIGPAPCIDGTCIFVTATRLPTSN